MTNLNNSFNAAIVQMVALSEELLTQRISSYSKLNQCKTYEDKHELEKLYINEISATANVIKLFTGREISFQWEKGANGEDWGGFALYEIMEDAPCEKIPCGVSNTTYSRYTGKQEADRRICWGKAKEEGKIVKIYELIYDVDANPRYVGGYLAPELQAE